MSEPATPTTPTPIDERAERRRSIGKYVKRLSTVLRRGSSKSGVPTASTSSATPPIAERPAELAARTEERPIETSEPPKPVATSAGMTNAPGAYARSAIQQERARALFAKYGLTLEAHEWIPTGTTTTVQRVEKPIRMRVHRNCHRCGLTFGADRVCVKCEHKRCKKCPRYPPKKPKDGSKAPVGVAKDTKGQDTTTTEKEGERVKRKRKPLLTIQSRTGGELVYQKPVQRIRRTCHKCETPFQPPTATICDKCLHVRCTRCPREPPKLNKWPDGYPGDAAYETSEDEDVLVKSEKVWRKPRQRVRWNCSECSSLMVDGKVCKSCDHERCDKCTRLPPKKVKKEYDPEVVKAVQEKLAAFKVREEPQEAATATATQ